MHVPPDLAITTGRCVLRAPCEADLPHVFSATRVPGFNDGLALGPHETMDDLRRVLARNLQGWRMGRAFVFTVEKSDGGGFVGRVLLRQTGEDGLWALAFWTHPDEQGHGYATEAARAVLAFGFDKLGAREIEACHLVTNLASRRVLDKLGFREDAYLERGLPGRDGGWLPGFRMVLACDAFSAPASSPAGNP